MVYLTKKQGKKARVIYRLSVEISPLAKSFPRELSTSCDPQSNNVESGFSGTMLTGAPRSSIAQRYQMPASGY